MNNCIIPSKSQLATTTSSPSSDDNGHLPAMNGKKVTTIESNNSAAPDTSQIPGTTLSNSINKRTVHSVKSNQEGIASCHLSNHEAQDSASKVTPQENFQLGWNGAQYHQNRSLPQKVASHLIEQITVKEPPTRVLDIGCGTGVLLLEGIKKFGPDVEYTGVDSNSSMIEEAKQNCKHSETKISPEKLEFYNTTIQEFSPVVPYDVVISSLTFHWIPKQEQAATFKKLYKHMTPGGCLAIMTAADKQKLPFGKALTKTMNHDDYKEALKGFEQSNYYFSEEQHRQWIENAGFEIKKLCTEQIDVEYETLDSMKDFIVSFSRQVKHLEKNSNKKLAESFINTLMANFKTFYAEYMADKEGSNAQNDHSGRYIFHNPNICIMAKKPNDPKVDCN